MFITVSDKRTCHARAVGQPSRIGIKLDINILMLGIVFKGTVMLISEFFWKRGVMLIQLFSDHFGKVVLKDID